MPANVSTWIPLDDFRPGIKARVSPANVAHQRSKVLGAATSEGTYRCQAMKDGSLGPLPGEVSRTPLALPAEPTSVHRSKFAIAGFHISGPIGVVFDFHVAWEWRVGTTQYFRWDRIRHHDGTNSTNVILQRTSAMSGLAVFLNSVAASPCWFHGHRSHASDPYARGLPQIAAAWSANKPANSFWGFWPNAADDDTYTPYLVGAPYWPSIALSHQNRSVILDHQPYPHGPDSGWNHNEDIYFTQGNLQTIQNPGRPQTFGMENACGYAGAVTTSHSEMLLLKAAGGGLLVRGDIANPTVLRIPGIPACGQTHHQPCVTPVGTVFLTAAAGAWLWSGGENAEPISGDAIDPQDFILPSFTQHNEFMGFHGRLWQWYEWVVFPNNWVWNWKENSWWRLQDPAEQVFLWCGPDYGIETGSLFLTTTAVTAHNEPVIYEYEANRSAASYRWESQPFPLFEDRQFKIREIVFVVSGKCSWEFDIYNQDGTYERHAFTSTRMGRPEYIRRNANVTAQEIKLTIRSTETAPGDGAGLVHEVRFGVQTPDTHYQQNG